MPRQPKQRHIQRVNLVSPDRTAGHMPRGSASTMTNVGKDVSQLGTRPTDSHLCDDGNIIATGYFDGLNANQARQLLVAIQSEYKIFLKNLLGMSTTSNADGGRDEDNGYDETQQETFSASMKRGYSFS